MRENRTPGSHAARRDVSRVEKKTAKRPERRVRERPPETRRAPRKRTAYIVATALAAVLVIALALVLVNSGERGDYRKYMRQANASYQEGDYDSALTSLRKAANIDRSDECLVLMADCYEAQGNLEKALEVLRKMDVTDPSVAQRIAALEQKRAQLLEAEKVTIAGKQFTKDTTALVLDGLGVTDEVLSDIKQLYSLETLSLMNNSLKDISALAELGGLNTLNLGGNRIEDISALAALTGLRTLYIDDNPVKDLTPLLKLTKLTSLSIRGIDITDEQLKKLSEALPGCAIHSDTSAEDAVDITIGGVTFKSDVEELDLSGKSIRSISVLAGCKELKKLNLSGNSVTDLCALMNIPGLEWLDVSSNHLSDLRPLMGMGTLRTLIANDNQVTATAAVGSMSSLTELELSNNPISDFSGLKKLRNIETLGLKNTGLDDSGIQYLEYLSSLSMLSIDDNPDISGETADELQKALGSCVISHSELIYSVDVSGTMIKQNATELDLAGKGITDISGIGNLGSLVTVDLSGNDISNIYTFQYTDSWETMKELDLSSNSVEDITAIANLINLETLDLSNNKVNSILPLKGLKNLRKLNLSGNPLTGEQIQELREALTNCTVTFG